MDSNHPIPQDVTGFQFRLIGDMTVKQFAYVAVGGIFTIVTLYAPLPLLIRIPLMILFGGSGAAVAFLPIEGRPMDLMIGNFLKALLTPNQYIFQKTGGTLALFDIQTQPASSQIRPFSTLKAPPATHATGAQKQSQLQEYLTTIHGSHLSEPEKKERAFMDHVFHNTPAPSLTPTPGTAQQTMPASNTQPVQHTQYDDSTNQNLSPKEKPETKKETVTQMVQKTRVSGETPQEQNASLSLQENVLTKELADTKNDEGVQTDAAKKQQAHLHAEELERQLVDIKNQKDELEAKLDALRAAQNTTPIPQAQPEEPANPVSQAPQDVARQTPVSPVAKPQQQAAIRKIPSEMAKSLGLPHTPDVPNLIIGIVKDPRENVLSNILVEVKDKDGTPARAFRTNQLGQFASATPLSNGTYNIEFEDPKGKHQFDMVEINANGEILMPLEVISHDAREELRKALFN